MAFGSSSQPDRRYKRLFATYIRRLLIAVHDAFFVRGLEGVGDLAGDGECFCHW